MPIDLGKLGKDGRVLNKEWKNAIAEHQKYRVKNKYHKENDMLGWNKKLQDINTQYRELFKSLEKKKKEEEEEAHKLMEEANRKAKEEEEKAKEAEEKAKEERMQKRRLNKEKRQLELSKMVPRKSMRLAKKHKLPRCPNGTRRNKDNKKCEAKSSTRKRCPKGTRKTYYCKYL